MTYARISGTGSYLPPRIVTNDDLAQKVDTNHEWIITRTGIEQRHMVDAQTCEDLAFEASQKALEAAGLKGSDIDLIIVATCSSSSAFPSAACVLQERIGAGCIAAFDVQSACAGFVYAMATASQFIEAGSVRHALVVGSEVISRALDWQDRSTCVLFGDGAGAVVLSASEEPGIEVHALCSDGSQADILYARKTQLGYHSDPYVRMEGPEVFRHAVTNLTRLVGTLCEKGKIDPASIDWFVPHQANIRIIQAVAHSLKMPMEKVVVTLNKHGNTSSASVPLALDVAVRDGRIQRGQRILIEAIGGGLSWGGLIVRF